MSCSFTLFSHYEDIYKIIDILQSMGGKNVSLCMKLCLDKIIIQAIDEKTHRSMLEYIVETDEYKCENEITIGCSDKFFNKLTKKELCPKMYRIEDKIHINMDNSIQSFSIKEPDNTYKDINTNTLEVLASYHKLNCKKLGEILKSISDNIECDDISIEFNEKEIRFVGNSLIGIETKVLNTVNFIENDVPKHVRVDLELLNKVINKLNKLKSIPDCSLKVYKSNLIEMSFKNNKVKFFISYADK